MADKFRYVDMGDITWCLGMRIQMSSSRHVITLDLDQYIQTVLAHYDFDQLQAVPNPKVHYAKRSRDNCPISDSDIAQKDQYSFRSVISSLMHAMPVDLSYVVTLVARLTANPDKPYWEALVRIFQYLKGTSNMTLTYSPVCDTPAPLIFPFKQPFGN